MQQPLVAKDFRGFAQQPGGLYVVAVRNSIGLRFPVLVKEESKVAVGAYYAVQEQFGQLSKALSQACVRPTL